MAARHLLSSSAASAKPFYVTTPIFYVNAVPHIGHVYSALLADAIARSRRLAGRSVVFATGTDEHGLKVQDAAIAAGMTPQQFCDDISASFRAVFDAFDISYTDYIRTTEERHKRAVGHMWERLSKAGAIYMGTHESWYCKSEESFLTETQVHDVIGPDGVKRKVSISTGHPVVWLQEPNYKFKLMDSQSALLKWLQECPDAIIPQSRYKEVVAGIESGLTDVSVSRLTSNVSWAIPVPGDPSHSIYVWLDALTNYLTVAGYPDAEGKHDFPWPADVHVVGKDILKFHSVYWPAFLMAAGRAPPRHIIAHGHWTVDKVKMSKSLGNVVAPMDLLAQHGVDSVRYFLLRDGGINSDGDFSADSLKRRVYSDLADTLGNLALRASATTLLPSQSVPAPGPLSPEDAQFVATTIALLPRILQAYETFDIPMALDHTFEILRETNRYFEASAPWKLKGDPARLNTVLYLALEAVRVCAICLLPAMPTSAAKLLAHIGVPLESASIASIETLGAFKRPAGTPFCSPGQKLVLFPKPPKA